VTAIARSLVVALGLAAAGCGDGGAAVDGSIPPSAAVFAGGSTACAITPAGALGCWSGAQPIPLTVSLGMSFIDAAMNLASGGGAISSDHALYGFDLVTFAASPKDAAQYHRVEVGNGGCAVRDDGALVCFGGPSSFLGLDPTPVQLGTELDWAVPSVGNVHACAIKTSGALSCWGNNFNGATGTGTAPGQDPAPTPVSGGGTWIDVSAGDVSEATCGIRDDHTLWCWGNEFGTSGVVRVPTAVDSATDWARVRIDFSHACAIKTSGELYCWGGNQQGQLGTGDMLPQPAPTRIGTDTDWRDVAVGTGFSCAAKRSGHVRCWGTLVSELDF
jgi:hypothetical protein